MADTGGALNASSGRLVGAMGGSLGDQAWESGDLIGLTQGFDAEGNPAADDSLVPMEGPPGGEQ